MRDKSRIKPMMVALEQHWRRHPDWRFGQLIANCVRAKTGALNCDPFYIEDDALMEGLRVLAAMDTAWEDENA